VAYCLQALEAVLHRSGARVAPGMALTAARGILDAR